MRLLLISLGAALVTGMLLLMTRLWGLGQAYQAFSHPFVDPPKPWMSVQVVTLEEAQKALDIKKDVIFWLNLISTADGQFLVTDPKNIPEIKGETLQERYKGDKTYNYDLRTLRIFFEKELLADEFLVRFPENRFILNINDNAQDIHTHMIKLIQKHKADSRVLIQSDADIVLKSIKTDQPLWLFGTSRSDVMRLLSFESIGLQPASPFNGDIFVSPFKVLNRPAFNEGVLEEVRRRKKNIMLGPLTSHDEYLKALSFKPDGYIFESFELFQSQLDLGPGESSEKRPPETLNQQSQ